MHTCKEERIGTEAASSKDEMLTNEGGVRECLIGLPPTCPKGEKASSRSPSVVLSLSPFTMSTGASDSAPEPFSPTAGTCKTPLRLNHPVVRKPRPKNCVRVFWCLNCLIRLEGGENRAAVSRRSSRGTVLASRPLGALQVKQAMRRAKLMALHSRHIQSSARCARGRVERVESGKSHASGQREASVLHLLALSVALSIVLTIAIPPSAPLSRV